MPAPLPALSEEQVDHLRELAGTGLPLRIIRHKLSDKYGIMISVDTLRKRMKLHGIQWTQRLQGAAAPVPWTDDMTAMVSEMLIIDVPKDDILHHLYTVFGIILSKQTLYRKIYEHGLASPRADPPSNDTEPAQTQDPAFPKIKTAETASAPMTALEPWKPDITRVRHCQYPIGDPKRSGFRFCDKAPLAGQPYCDEHRLLCWVRAPKSLAHAA